MLNNWEIIGNFMYPPDVYRRLLALVRSELLDLGAIEIKSFPLAKVPVAVEAASKSSGLRVTIVKPAGY